MNKLHLVAVSIAMLLVAGAWAQETDPSADITRDWAEQEAQRAENQARMDELHAHAQSNGRPCGLWHETCDGHE